MVQAFEKQPDVTTEIVAPTQKKQAGIMGFFGKPKK